jgi:hypothetical protein
VLGGTERQRGHGGDQVHPQAHLGDVVGVVVVGRDHRAADRVHQRHLTGHAGQRGPDRLDLGLEVGPEHARLGREVAEERPLADPGLGRDLLDGGVLEPALGEQPQRDQPQLTVAGGRWTSPADARLLVRYLLRFVLLGHPCHLLETSVKQTPPPLPDLCHLLTLTSRRCAVAW